METVSMASGGTGADGGSIASSSRKRASASKDRDGKRISTEVTRVLPRQSLQELLKKVAPGEMVDPAVEDFLLDVADDFVDSVAAFACKLAAHRKSEALEVKDIILHLERAWDMVLPGFEGDDLKEFKIPNEARAHNKRMLEVRRAIASSGTIDALPIQGRET